MVRRELEFGSHSTKEKSITMTFDFTLVLGGAASGKSAWAENHVLSFSTQPIYVATAQAYDNEMKKKVLLHQKRRSANWRTFEEPLALVEQLSALRKSEVVLIDCATMWLSNLLLKDQDVSSAADSLCAYLPSFEGRIVIVSNEVGHSVVPSTKLGRRFQSDQGHLNQKLASIADRVVMVTAGLPALLKGRLSEDMN